MKSKFVREERFSDGMENTHNDNTLEITTNENEFRCVLCSRKFRTNRGFIQHLNTCRRKHADNVLQHSSEYDVLNEEAQLRERFYWKEVPGSIFRRDIQQVYDKIVYWRKNIFMVPRGDVVKIYQGNNKNDQFMDREFTFGEYSLKRNPCYVGSASSKAK